jgi:DNA repair protein RecO (recombination protein O)
MYYQLNGLVLRSRVSAEADKLVTLYTYEWGKITAVVPGAKKIKAKFSAASEPITESEFMIYAKHQSARPKVTSVKMTESYMALRKSWINFSIASYCAEVCDQLTPFNAENPRKYELLRRTWLLLGEAQNPWRIYTAFVLRFLKLSGYNFYEYLVGEGIRLPEREFKMIRCLTNLSGTELDRNFELDSASEEKIRRYIDSYLSLYLPRPLSCKEYFRKVHKSLKACVARETLTPSPADCHSGNV